MIRVGITCGYKEAKRAREKKNDIALDIIDILEIQKQKVFVGINEIKTEDMSQEAMLNPFMHIDIKVSIKLTPKQKNEIVDAIIKLLKINSRLLKLNAGNIHIEFWDNRPENVYH